MATNGHTLSPRCIMYAPPLTDSGLTPCWGDRSCGGGPASMGFMENASTRSRLWSTWPVNTRRSKVRRSLVRSPRSRQEWLRAKEHVAARLPREASSRGPRFAWLVFSCPCSQASQSRFGSNSAGSCYLEQTRCDRGDGAQCDCVAEGIGTE